MSNASIVRTIGQRIDPFVGPEGRRTLKHLEVGTTQLEVSYGTRRTTVKVEVVRGKTRQVRVVLPVLTLEVPKPATKDAKAR